MTKRELNIMALQMEQEFNEKLVDAVGKYTCLYNYMLAEYSRKDLTEKAWAAVAKEVNDTVNTCKQKWKNIRSAFVRNLKSAQSLSSTKSIKPYYLYDSMQFLLPFIKTNAPNFDTQENLPSPVARGTENIDDKNESENLEVKNEISVEDTQLDVTEPTEPAVRRAGNIQKIAKNKAKKRKSDKPNPDRIFVEFCKRCKSRSDSEEANKMFLLSLLPEVNQMNPQQTRRFKRQLMNLIDDILDEPLSMTASNANYGQSDIFHNSSRPSSSSSSIHTYDLNS